MTSFETLIGDPYNRKARLQPALFTFLPTLVGALLLVPAVETVWITTTGLVVYCGGAMWLTQFGRERGKALEPTLYLDWGGKPSVAMLRHRDGRLPRPLKERYKAFLAQSVPGLRLPSADEEVESPGDADDAYESANAWLLSQTRDRQRFKLLFEENVNYGFRRNLWALKPVALAMDAVIFAAIAAFFAVQWAGSISETLNLIEPLFWIACLLTAAHGLWFGLLVRRNWVRMPAEAYARHLLAASDVLRGSKDGG